MQKAVAAGRIPVHHEGDEVFIDPEEADRAWAENTQPEIGRTDGSGGAAGNGGSNGHGELALGTSYSDARAQREVVDLKIRELKLEEIRGNLVSADKVRRDAFETGRTIRERMMAIPPRLASLVLAKAEEGNVRAIEELLAAELHDALKGLAGGESSN